MNDKEAQRFLCENTALVLGTISRSPCREELMRMMGFPPNLSDLWKVISQSGYLLMPLINHINSCPQCIVSYCEIEKRLEYLAR